MKQNGGSIVLMGSQCSVGKGGSSIWTKKGAIGQLAKVLQLFCEDNIKIKLCTQH